MKIAISSQGDGLTAKLDPRFGRARMFVIYDDDTGESSSIDNARNLNAAQGAGVQAAQTVSRSGAKILITGHCGPKAFSALTAAGIKIFTAPEINVGEAIELYKKGLLAEASGADVDGHW
ncbi:MAG TPA: NifB/NifX family molybdenum-iron cluster-binding protein [Desulfomonilia bacterium]